MVLLSGIKGQDNAVRYLTRSMEKGRLSASYLFSGPRGVGRALCARAFIKSLVCKDESAKGDPSCRCSSCVRVDANEHPDIRWIKPAKNKSIKIEEIRGIKDFLSLKPFESPLSAAVIEDAHMMTTDASNALLKVLEEPPGDSTIILISDKKELLLATVLSRCSEVRFTPLSISDTKDMIARNSGMDDKAAGFLAYLSQGSPGLALEMAKEGISERRDGLAENLVKLILEENPSLLNWDTENKDELIEDIESMIMFLRDVALEREGMGDMVLDKDLMEKAGKRMPSEKGIDGIYRVVDRLIGIKRALVGNVNPKIVAQALPGIIKR